MLQLEAMDGRAGAVATVVDVVVDPVPCGVTTGRVVAGTTVVVVTPGAGEVPDATAWAVGTGAVVVVTVVVAVEGTVVVVVDGPTVVVVVVDGVTGTVVVGAGPVGTGPVGPTAVGDPVPSTVVTATTVARPEVTGAATPLDEAAMPPVAVPRTTRAPTATTAMPWRRRVRPGTASCARRSRFLPIAPHFFRGAGPAHRHATNSTVDSAARLTRRVPWFCVPASQRVCHLSSFGPVHRLHWT